MTDPVVRLERTQLSVEKGAKAKLSVAVRNRAAGVESFRLEVLGVGVAEWSEVTPLEVRVDPDQEATVVVVFSPPAGDRVRVGNYPFAVRAESSVDAEVSALAEGDLEIDHAVEAPVRKPIQSRLPATIAAVLVLGLMGLIVFALTRGPRNEPAGLAQVMPGSPSLTAVNRDASSVRLVWENQPDIGSYRIHVLSSDGLLLEVTSIDGSLTTYMLDDLAPDTEYCFQVEAVRGARTSPLSEIRCVRTSVAQISGSGSPSTTEGGPGAPGAPGGPSSGAPSGGTTANPTPTAEHSLSPTETTSSTSTPGLDTSGAPPTPGSTFPDAPGDLAAFQESCEQQFASGEWHTGSVLYPRSLNLELGSTVTYNAIVELGDAGTLPQQTIAGAEQTVEPVLVQCLISAKLVAVGDDLEVGSDTTELTESDGWYLQTFTPTGTVEWTWTVTAHTPGEHHVQLLLRPAVAYGGSMTGSSTGQQAYLTPITVTASTMENVSYWFDTQFTTLGKIVGVLGAAVVGVMTWLVLFSETCGKLRKRNSSELATERDRDRQALVAGRGDRVRRSGPRTQTTRRPPRR